MSYSLTEIDLDKGKKLAALQRPVSASHALKAALYLEFAKDRATLKNVVKIEQRDDNGGLFLTMANGDFIETEPAAIVYESDLRACPICGATLNARVNPAVKRLKDGDYFCDQCGNTIDPAEFA